MFPDHAGGRTRRDLGGRNTNRRNRSAQLGRGPCGNPLQPKNVNVKIVPSFAPFYGWRSRSSTAAGGKAVGDLPDRGLETADGDAGARADAAVGLADIEAAPRQELLQF